MASQFSPPEQRPSFYRSISATSHLTTRSSRALTLTRTFSHRSDKPRLYLALFPKGGATGGGYGSSFSCDSYHWALVLGPKTPLRTEAGTAYHVVHGSSGFTSTSFYCEETDLAEQAHLARNMLARVALAKVLDEQRLITTLRSLTPSPPGKNSKGTYGSIDSTSDEYCRLSCLSWVKAAWEALSGDSQRTMKSYFGPEEWEAIENRARKYVKRKRLQGRYSPSTEPGDVTWNPAEVPTWNYWENRETTD